MEIYRDDKVIVKRLVMKPFENNVYLLLKSSKDEALIIDAANEASRILEALEGAKASYIIQTHCHMDHVMALKEVRESTGAKLAIHPDEPEASRYNPDILLGKDQQLSLGGINLRIFHTPGHTPGGVCVLYGGILFSGDTLFPGGPGKTSSPEDFKLIIRSIVDKIYRLPDDIILYPGHGESITIGDSKKEYQVFVKSNRGEDIYGDVLWLGK